VRAGQGGEGCGGPGVVGREFAAEPAGGHPGLVGGELDVEGGAQLHRQPVRQGDAVGGEGASEVGAAPVEVGVESVVVVDLPPDQVGDEAAVEPGGRVVDRMREPEYRPGVVGKEPHDAVAPGRRPELAPSPRWPVRHDRALPVVSSDFALEAPHSIRFHLNAGNAI
jgi:hypothetical protein